MNNQTQFRADVLAAYGASSSEIDELLAYNHNVFYQDKLKHPFTFPLPSEAHITTWEEYATAANTLGAFAVLQQRLVQLQFPILEGISTTPAYRNVTRKGTFVDNCPEATGLVLTQPDKLHLEIYPSLAGKIPVLLPGNREDFVTLVQALTQRNEPKEIPASMGACIVSGFNNWDRIHRYRQQWEQQNPHQCSKNDWTLEFQRLIPQKELYQDRFIILSNSPYSNIPAQEIGVEETTWQSISLKIRLEHECTHYLTNRLFKSMRNNAFDELIADYRGIVAAIGYYRADWFLHFMGLESFPEYREGGRLQNYRGQPPLSDGAFKILQSLLQAAAFNLQRFDAEYINDLATPYRQMQLLVALSYLTLEELADPGFNSLIQRLLDKA
ncbi:DUF7005 family protein [Nostoc sp. CMAA1605]|uniref:DUF7005 family protein n=1 Tax=Nostoc sp. CMAA1605 TaxID=2055159 RepID=UPI001F41BD6F|nr:hypothetical protein [Nostoc sp. CMAA1605]MCF4965688.1 hypothetical protein [Nostoc sp. CMAA1605]